MTSTNSNHDKETSSFSSGSSYSDSEDERDSGNGSCDSDETGNVDQRQNTETLYNLQRQRAKLMNILSSLNGDVGESEQLVALSELCELLSFCTDDSFSNVIANALSSVLVKLARHGSNQDIMLLAIRALTYLCDAHPQSSGFVVSHDGVPALCERLMVIDYIDVAEQCFQALEKISREQPLACLQFGAIMAVLTYVDFFSTSVQRVALSTVLNICDELPSESPSPFMEAVPTLCKLLQYEDNQLVETVASCLIKIAERVRHSTNLLDELCKHGLIHQATHLIDLNSRTTLCQPVYTGLIGILAKLASGSLTALKTLFELNISSILKDILSTYGLSLGTPSSHRVDGHCNQALEVLKLLNELLPVIGVNQGVQLEKEVFLVNQPNLLQKFGMDLLPVLIQVVSSGGDLYICYGCLSVINKLVYFSESNMLLELLTSSNIFSLLAGIFTRKDHHVLTLALQIVDNILKKLKDVYLGAFVKEGVFFAIDSLLAPEKSSQFMFLSQKSAARDARRCLCYLFDASPSPSTSESENCRFEKDSVQKLAKHIKTNYFETESLNSENGVTGILRKLKAPSTTFSYMVNNMSMDDGSFVQKEEALFSLLHQIMSQLNGRDPISTFEFVESGVVKLLADYLSNGQFSREKTNINGSVSQPYVTEKRLEFFGKLFLTSSNPHLEKFPLSALISKLQSALSSVENFPVILNPVFKKGNYYVTVPHNYVIAYPSLKIQFVRGEGETDLSDYFEELVTVDPFSSFDSIEEFLWPKVGKKRSTDKETITDALDGSDSPLDSTPQNPDLKEVEGVSPITHAMQNLMKQDGQNSTQEVSSMSPECPESSSCEDASPRLMFYLEEEQLDVTLNLYQAILQLKSKSENDTVTAAPLWSQLIRVTYKKASKGNESISQPSDHQATCSSDWSFTQYTPLFSSTSISKLSIAVEKFSSAYDILFLLRILDRMNRYRFHLMSRERICAFAEGRIEDLDNLKVESSDFLGNEFVSRRLTEKLEQQMRDPLAISPGGMPSWCVQLMDLCPFLFGFEGRCNYFKLAAFGKRQSQPSSSSSHSGENYSPRKKFLVYRHQILESAVKIMDLHAGQKAVLEVEYDEEVGTGLGPTLEFFTLVSNEFQNSGMGMWREDNNTSLPSIVGSPFGLFPRPWSFTMSNSGGVEFSEVVKKFVLLGQVVAKALQDGRVLDIFFSKTFYKLILGQDLTLYDIQSFEPELGRILIEFQALVLRKKHLESSEGKSMLQIEPSFRNTTIEDLCLDFTLPGYPDYVLISGTSIDMVNMMNLEEYVTLVVDATVNLGISRQMDAFRSGFNQVFPISHLQIFNEEELERLLCGEREIWNSSELSDHLKFDHGYTASSPPIVNLLEIIQEFNHEQQKAFLQFVTGAPRLPPGGLASLNPKLTIVRKHCSQRVDEDLPSVMTCANYLKLPPYSSKEKMKEKLLYAITEGQGSFHLS